MKQKSIFTLLLSVIITIVFCIKSNAQFTNASATEYRVYGSSLSPTSVNADILDYSGDTYRVSVVSDANGRPYLSWENSIGTPGYLDLNLVSISGATHAYFADVVIIEDQGDNTIHAITAWFVNTNFTDGWEIEDFIYDSGTGGFISNNLIAIASGTMGTSCNIDCDDAGNFIIVYDDGSQNIYYVTGDLNNGVNINGSQAYDSNKDGLYPDVCLNDVSPSHNGYISYIDGSGDLYVQYDVFSDFSSGSASLVNSMIASPTDAYFYPRIACNGNDDWTVVLWEADHMSYNDIIGYNSNTGNGTRIDYTAAYSPALNSYINSLPCVVYDNSTNVWVGWLHDNTGAAHGNGPDALYPLVVECNGVGAPSGSNYLIGSTTNNSQDGNAPFGMAARNASDIMIAYYNMGTFNDMVNKYVSPATASSTGFKMELYQSNILEYLSEESNVIFKLFDLKGSLVFQTVGSNHDIRAAFFKQLDSNFHGIFVATMLKENGELFSSKIFFQ